MKTSSALATVLAIVLVVSLLTIWFKASLQDFQARNVRWNGISDFQNEFKAKEIDSLDEIAASPNGVLVAIPYLDYYDDELSLIKQFVDNGGALLLMDDFGYGNRVLEYFGVSARFSQGTLLDPLFSYKNQNFPRILDFSPQAKETNITLNHATALTGVPPANVIASSSSTSFLDLNGNGVQDYGEPKGPFPVVAEIRSGKGTIKVVSDPSLIINGMAKLGNASFVRYLLYSNGEPEAVLVDRSHLIKSFQLVSRDDLNTAREFLSGPYALLGMVAIVFILVSRFMLDKGEIIG